MIIVMKKDANKDDILYVIVRVESLGLKTHTSKADEQTLISVLGDLRALPIHALTGLRGVDRVLETRHPYRLASLEFKGERTIISIGNSHIGGENIIIMAGPCAVETQSQLMETAWRVREAGAHFLRGGAFKPRSSPYSFQGLGEDGLKLLAQARKETGLGIITEVMATEQVPLVSRYSDILQVGARNMQNYALLHAVGESKIPVRLKRGMMSTMEELLMSAEYILANGNQNVILCERGIRTFETYTRNTLDINAVPMLKELTHLPIIVDPSHATGKTSLVTPASKAAVAAGADGLLIEVHPDPDNALSDGYQSLTPKQFEKLIKEISLIADAVGRPLEKPLPNPVGLSQ